ncbi:hypothetical protein FACS1894219_01210 [Clostridia bacterium]|nr:hypothetical protein FACS1894219_01210 [Clostridia bacterium]
MNQTKNFKISALIRRAVTFLIYYFSAGFSAEIVRLMLKSLFAIIFGAGSDMQGIALDIVGVAAIAACLAVFSSREGYNDTDTLRYSIGKMALAVFASALMFASAAVPLKFMSETIPADDTHGIFQLIYRFFISQYYLSSWVHFGFVLAVSFLILVLAYRSGRNRWIAAKKRRIEELRRTGD